MSISFVAPRDFHQPPVAPAPETFELLSADKTAFARLFPFSLAAFKTGLAGNLPGFNFSDNEIKMAAQAIVQAGLIGGGASAAAARASDIVSHSCARELAIAILEDAGV